jgi:hypothetical protein
MYTYQHTMPSHRRQAPTRPCQDVTPALVPSQCIGVWLFKRENQFHVCWLWMQRLLQVRLEFDHCFLGDVICEQPRRKKAPRGRMLHMPLALRIFSVCLLTYMCFLCLSCSSWCMTSGRYAVWGLCIACTISKRYAPKGGA